MDLTVISQEIPTADTGEEKKKLLGKAKVQVTHRGCAVSIPEGFQDPTG